MKGKTNVLMIMIGILLISAVTFAGGTIKVGEYYPGGGGPVDWVESVSLHKSQVVAIGINFNLWATVYVDHHFDENGNESSYIIGASQHVGLTGIGLDAELTNSGSSHFIYNNKHDIEINGYGTVKHTVTIGGQQIVNFKNVNLTINYSAF